jgi:tetratricopeptide (TPR) repeat protein
MEQTTQVMAVRDGIDMAVMLEDDDALAVYARQLSSLDGDWADYYRAYVDYRRSQIPGTAKKDAKRLLNECIEILNELIERRPDMAEAYSLNASCNGISAQFYMLRAAARGSAANKSLQQALKLGAENPRVILQDAQSLIFRPALFGGDKEKAMERLKLALERFADWESPDPEAPVWGEAEAWLTIARLHRDQGRPDEARDAFAQALALAPSFRAAKDELAAMG